MIEAVCIEPPHTATACVIWLHGLGADGSDFAGVIPDLKLPRHHSIRFLFPHSPSRPVTMNDGFVMPAWYDIIELDEEAPEDEEGIRQAGKDLEKWIQNQIEQGISSQRIVLIGFSQGGALALYTALRFKEPLGGVAALSSYLPLRKTLKEEQSSVNLSLPIWMAHGLIDNTLSYWIGHNSLLYLQEAGYFAQWNSYPIEHTVSLKELADIGHWIKQVIE